MWKSVTKQVQNRVHDLSIGAFFIIWRDASVWIGPVGPFVVRQFDWQSFFLSVEG